MYCEVMKELNIIYYLSSWFCAVHTAVSDGRYKYLEMLTESSSAKHMIDASIEHHSVQNIPWNLCLRGVLSFSCADPVFSLHTLLFIISQNLLRSMTQSCVFESRVFAITCWLSSHGYWLLSNVYTVPLTKQIYLLVISTLAIVH